MPVVTYALIALNILVFFIELNGGDAFVQQWAFIPSLFFLEAIDADNGVGRAHADFSAVKTGLGNKIVNALARQLDAEVEIVSGQSGTTVSIAHRSSARC